MTSDSFRPMLTGSLYIHDVQVSLCIKVMIFNFSFSNIVIYIYIYIYQVVSCSIWGWSGGAKVLGKLPVPGRPTTLDNSRARAYCACNRCGWGLFGHFFLSSITSFLSSPWKAARYRLKYCLKGPLNPKNQPTNQSCSI